MSVPKSRTNDGHESSCTVWITGANGNLMKQKPEVHIKKNRFCSFGLVCHCIGCLSSVFSLVCVVYLWTVLNQMEEIGKQLTSLSERNHQKTISVTKTTSRVLASLRSKDDKTGPMNSHDSGHDDVLIASGKTTESYQPMNDETIQRIQDQTLRVDIADRQTSAIHFVPIGMGEHSIQFTNNAMCIDKYGGILCRNNTFRNLGSNCIVQFWVKAPWTQAHHGSVIPIRSDSPSAGLYRVEAGGLYLIYLNVLISATYSKHDVGIFISGTKKLICRENLDYVRGASSLSPSAKAKTCSISGVFYIEQNQTISVHLVTRNTEIYLDSYNTNFGAVLLA